jgi:hypothetical protein
MEPDAESLLGRIATLARGATAHLLDEVKYFAQARRRHLARRCVRFRASVVASGVQAPRAMRAAAVCFYCGDDATASRARGGLCRRQNGDGGVRGRDGASSSTSRATLSLATGGLSGWLLAGAATSADGARDLKAVRCVCVGWGEQLGARCDVAVAVLEHAAAAARGGAGDATLTPGCAEALAQLGAELAPCAATPRVLAAIGSHAHSRAGFRALIILAKRAAADTELPAGTRRIIIMARDAAEAAMKARIARQTPGVPD